MSEPTVARLLEVSYFFPAHNEADNMGGLVAEALETLPSLADRFEIVIVDDGSRDETPRLADELAAAHPEVRAVHHPTNLGYGAALRSGFAAARFSHVAFTDGDRQFHIEDLGGATDVIDRFYGSRPVYVIRANAHDLGLVTAQFVIQDVLTAGGESIGSGSTALYEVVGRVGG